MRAQSTCKTTRDFHVIDRRLGAILFVLAAACIFDERMEKKEFCDWTSLDLSRWLSENGLPQDICETFEGKFVSRRLAACILRARGRTKSR